MTIESYHDLRVWQERIILAKECYLLPRHFPKEELFGLTSQVRRASASVPANIAEGNGRETTTSTSISYALPRAISRNWKRT
jgi:four helix bundle protein